MRVECIYYAFDDTEFYEEAECLEYEKDKRELFKAVQFFDEELKLMPQKDAEAWQDAMYFRVVNPSRTNELFNFLYSFTEIDRPVCNNFHKGDVFYYDTDYDEWVNLTEQIEKLTAIQSRFEKEGEKDS